MEMCLLRNMCWTIATSPLPADAEQSELWLLQDNWARGEIHLCCESDVQDLILTSSHACESWTILKHEFSLKADLRINQLRKEFSSIVMTEPSCAEYIKRVRRLVSELKECGDKVKDEDVAYTMLLGLKEKFIPLVVMLTNLSSAASPLSLTRVCEQILTEELRLQPSLSTTPAVSDPHVNNSLAYKSDRMFRGDLKHALVTRTGANYRNFRQSPYPPRDQQISRENAYTQQRNGTY